MLWAVLACMDYNIESGKKPDLRGDTADLNLETEIDTLEDTAVPEDTAEEDIVEEFVASAKMYANTSGELYEINPENGDARLIGPLADMGVQVDGFEDIAIDLTGHMYGGAEGWLYLINPNTAEIRPICPLDDLDSNPLERRTTALAFTSGGDLIIGKRYSLFVMNIQTCMVDTLIAYSFNETSGDIVGLPDRYLYWSVQGDSYDYNDRLVRVDPETGEETEVGSIGARSLYGMGYANDALFGFSGEGTIVRIDSSSGSSTVLRQHDGISWWGATTNPVVWE